MKAVAKYDTVTPVCPGTAFGASPHNHPIGASDAILGHPGRSCGIFRGKGTTR